MESLDEKMTIMLLIAQWITQQRKQQQRQCKWYEALKSTKSEQFIGTLPLLDLHRIVSCICVALISDEVHKLHTKPTQATQGGHVAETTA